LLSRGPAARAICRPVLTAVASVVTVPVTRVTRGLAPGASNRGWHPRGPRNRESIWRCWQVAPMDLRCDLLDEGPLPRRGRRLHRHDAAIYRARRRSRRHFRVTRAADRASLPASSLRARGQQLLAGLGCSCVARRDSIFEHHLNPVGCQPSVASRSSIDAFSKLPSHAKRHPRVTRFGSLASRHGSDPPTRTSSEQVADQHLRGFSHVIAPIGWLSGASRCLIGAMMQLLATARAIRHQLRARPQSRHVPDTEAPSSDDPAPQLLAPRERSRPTDLAQFIANVTSRGGSS
jgi:hypothetical protein